MPAQLLAQDWVDGSSRIVAQRRAIMDMLGDGTRPAKAPAPEAPAERSEIHVAPGQEAHLELERTPTALNAPVSAVRQSRNNEPVLKLDCSPAALLARTSKRMNTNTSPVLQGANIHWSKKGPPIIVDIDFGKRSGKQEDHTTAFTVFELGVLNNLKNKSLEQAIVQLLLLTNEITEFPSFLEYKDKGLSNKVRELKARLEKLLQGLLDEDINALYAAGELGGLIDDYIRVRNLVPGTKMAKSDVTRPQPSPSPGVREKEGKAALLESVSELETGSSVADVEPKIQEALGKLHDYITQRKALPPVDQFISYAAQHFISLLQAVPALVPHAEEILEIWMHQIYEKWHKVLGLEWGPFAREMVSLSGWYVKQIGTETKGPIRLSLSDEELGGLSKGALPDQIFRTFIATRARRFILNNSISLTITGYSGDSIQFRFGPLGG